MSLTKLYLMGRLPKYICILIPLLLVGSIILVVPQLDNGELILPAQSGKAYGLLGGTQDTALMLIPTAAFAGTVVWYAALEVALMAVYPASQYPARQYQAYKSWKDASDVYNVGAYPESLEDFELAYPLLKTNGVVLVQYGKALEMAGKYEGSIAILNEAKKYLNNTVLYTCLGNNYKTLGKKTDAERAYLHAWYMAPARFYPLYLLAKLYDETGQHEKAVAMANKVMGKEVKIESTAVEEIKEEMRKITEKSKTELLNKNKAHTVKNLNPIYKGTKEGAYCFVVLTDKFMLQKW